MPRSTTIVLVTALAAFWLYIDRVCFSTLAGPMKQELLLPEQVAGSVGVPAADEAADAAARKRWADGRMSFALGAFFLTYALFQIPMGSLADRHGARLVLALSIAAWSAVTMATGFVTGFLPLVGIRLLLGVTEAGAYPAAAGLVKTWVGPGRRGLASSTVALGGRLGGAVAPWLTATLDAALAGGFMADWSPPSGSGAAANWRGVFVLYGLCGLAMAVLFWAVVRDRPAGEPAAGPAAADGGLLAHAGTLARDRNMWLFGGLEFAVNLGWAFVVTLLPTYLAEAFGTPLDQVGRMQSVALGIGCVGMFFGGVFTDALRSRLGPRLGRSVPVGLAVAGCGLSFLAIPFLPTVWLVVVAMGAMAFLVDMHGPGVWSFAQDVGGRNVGAALGWGNMWGNIGAALSPIVLTQIRQQASWNTAFVVAGCVLLLGAVCGFLLDATKPVAET